MMMLSLLSSFYSSLEAGVALPITVSLIWKIPHRSTQRFVSKGILDPMKLTIKINHRRKYVDEAKSLLLIVS